MSQAGFDHRMRSSGDIADELQKHLSFSLVDLQQNQQGKLSGMQWDRFLHQEVAIPLLWSLFALVAGLLMRIAYSLFTGKNITEAFGDLATTPRFSQLWKAAHGEFVENVGTIIAIVTLLGLLETLRRLPYRLILDLLMRDVHSAEGKVSIIMRGVNDGQTEADRRGEFQRRTGTGRSFEDWEDRQGQYKLYIEGQHFGASKEVIQTIEEGQRYRAYYTRYGHRLVALEPK